MSSREIYPNFSEQRVERVEVAHNPVSLTAEPLSRKPPSSIAEAGFPRHSDINESNTLYGNVSISLYRDGLQPARLATIDELFSNLESTSRLKQALALLDGAIKQAEAALSSDAQPVASDDDIQVLYSLLPELFCCRSLGDGFAAVINALQQAAANQRGVPIDRPQIEAIMVILRKLRQSPFLPYADAVDIVLKLEDTGLIVDLPALSYLADTPEHEEDRVR